MAITFGAVNGNWSDATKWVGGVAPTAASDVLLTVASANVTIDGTSGAPNLCRSLDCTGYTGTLTQAGGGTLNVGDGTIGHFKLVAGMTYAPAATSMINFVSTTGTNNITVAGKIMADVTFNGVGGTWQLQDAFNNTSSSTNIVLTNGTLQTNNQTVTGGLTSSNTNTRALTLGTTTWTFEAGKSWNISDPTNMTYSGASATIATSATTGTANNFSGGGLTYNNFSCTTLTTGNITVSGANTFGTLTLSKNSGTSSATSGYTLSANQTVSGTFTSTVTSGTWLRRNFIRSDTEGTARTITAATVTVDYLDLRDITGAGAGSWNLSAITGGSGDCGGNTSITFNTPKNCYMKTAVSANWSGANWYTTSGGSTPIAPTVPLPQDTAIFDSASVTAGSKTITQDGARICGFTWNGVANSPVYAIATIECYGNVAYDSGMTTSGTAVMTLKGRGSQTITSEAITVTHAITINSFGGTYTMQDAFTTSRSTNTAITITNGAWNCGATNALTFTGANGGLTQTGGTFTNGSGGIAGCIKYVWSGSNAMTINMGTGTWEVKGTGTGWDNTASSATWNPSTSIIRFTDTSVTSKTFAGNGATYYDLYIDGAASNGVVTLTGSNTFHNIELEPDCAVDFTASTNTTFNDFICVGTSGHNIVIGSTSTTNATLTSTANVDGDYLTISDLTCAGNTPFYAGANSTDAGGGNVNWTFTVRPAGTVIPVFMNQYRQRWA